MSANRSNSRSARKPLSAYAKLRKQRYDKQYRLDIAIFGHSRWSERMREAGRLDDDGCIIRRREASGKFSTGYRRHLRTSPEELNLFLDDLVGAPSSIRFCQICSQVLNKCTCWDNFPRYDFRSLQNVLTEFSNADAERIQRYIDLSENEEY